MEHTFYEKMIIHLSKPELTTIYQDLLKRPPLTWEIDCWIDFCKKTPSKIKDLVKIISDTSMSKEIQQNFLKTKGFSFHNNTISKKINQYQLCFDSNDIILIENYYPKELYEKETVTLITKLIKPGMKIINIGANIGYFTILLANLVGPSGKVFSFEPHPENFEFLRKNLEINNCTNVESIMKAISNKNEKTTLLHSTSSAWHSLGTKEGPGFKRIPVETITIDDFLKDLDIEIDFVIMDAEGSETNIIQGMTKTLQKNPHLEIIAEYNPATLEFVDSSGMDLITIIKKIGFSIYLIEKNGELKLITGEKLLKDYPKNKFTNIFLTREPEKFN